MMSGCGILTNGKGTRREYCEFSLDELQVCYHKHTHASTCVHTDESGKQHLLLVFQEGDHIGLMRKASGALHFYINGIDQGETHQDQIKKNIKKRLFEMTRCCFTSSNLVLTA